MKVDCLASGVGALRGWLQDFFYAWILSATGTIIAPFSGTGFSPINETG